jgi:hypothetical protein
MYRVVIIITLFVFLLSCESNKTASYYAVGLWTNIYESMISLFS